MYRADAFTPFNLNLSARTGSARACARDRQNRHITPPFKRARPERLSIFYASILYLSKRVHSICKLIARARARARAPSQKWYILPSIAVYYQSSREGSFIVESWEVKAWFSAEYAGTIGSYSSNQLRSVIVEARHRRYILGRASWAGLTKNVWHRQRDYDIAKGAWRAQLRGQDSWSVYRF
jgi:hypothetical protein